MNSKKTDRRSSSCASRPVLAAFLFLLLTGSCKKDAPDSDPYGHIPRTDDRAEQILDSMYMYANEIWLWNEALPGYADFAPRKYKSGAGIEGYRSCLFNLLQHARREDGRPYEEPMDQNRLKYSYLTDEEPSTGGHAGNSPLAVPNEQLAVNLQGEGNDFGFEVGQRAPGDVRLLYASPGSPAHQAGFARGDRIVRINGTAATSTARVRSFLNGMAEISLEAVSPDGAEKSATIRKKNYQSNGILKSRVIASDGQNIGYLALARFANANGLMQDLENIFQAFAAASVETLVLDLRYNTGGYVRVAEDIANLMAPPALHGKTMYAEHFGATLQQGRATILKNQPYHDANGKPVMVRGRAATLHDVDYGLAKNTKAFKKTGSFQSLKKVYFITTGNTASAAEMLIQIFRPYLAVKTVGSRTYGKPVGFFGIRLDRYTLYYSSFHVRNANGAGDYYDGIAADVRATDDIAHDFGDGRESSLAAALRAIAGKPPFASVPLAAVRPESTAATETLHSVSGFRGMVEDFSGRKLTVED